MFCFLASSAGNMSLPTIGNGMESSFECRALSTRACAHLIRGRVGCAVGCVALIIHRRGSRRSEREQHSVSPRFFEADLWIASILGHLLTFFQRGEIIGMYDGETHRSRSWR